MCLKYLTQVAPTVIVGLASCINGARVRQHDAMAAAITRDTSERPRTEAVDASSLVVDGALDRAAVVAAVLARNPDLDSARAAWRAAVAAFPSAVSLDDPTASYALAPFSIGSDVAFGQRVEVIPRLALLPAGEVGGRQLPGQPPVPLGAAGEDQQVRAGRVRVVGARHPPKRQFGAEDGGHIQLGRSLGEPHHPV